MRTKQNKYIETDEFISGETNQGTRFLIDKDDLEIVKKYKWHTSDNGYICAKVKGKYLRLHRLVMNAPDGIFIDHRNSDKTDNRKSNLRFCCVQQNQFNQKKHKNSTSIYKGVSWFEKTKKWRSYIVINYKQKHLGYFNNEIEAATAYDLNAKMLFGEFAKLNFQE